MFSYATLEKKKSFFLHIFLCKKTDLIIKIFLGLTIWTTNFEKTDLDKGDAMSADFVVFENQIYQEQEVCFPCPKAM